MHRSGGKSLARLLALLAGVHLGWLAAPARAESIVTGGKTGTYFAIGTNLRDFVAPSLDVLDSKGSWANVEDLSRTKGVTLAIVQSDVYAAFVQMRDSPAVPQATRREYGQLLANLRVFMPLYPEEIHFLVRKDDPIDFIHQIKGRQIWMDVEKSGTYLTALNIYGKLFQERPAAVQPFINPTAVGDDDGTRRRRSALMALSDPAFYKAYPRVDVVVLVGGQPLALLEKNVPSNLKLLKLDAANPGSVSCCRSTTRPTSGSPAIRCSTSRTTACLHWRWIPISSRRILPIRKETSSSRPSPATSATTSAPCRRRVMPSGNR